MRRCTRSSYADAPSPREVLRRRAGHEGADALLRKTGPAFGGGPMPCVRILDSGASNQVQTASHDAACDTMGQSCSGTLPAVLAEISKNPYKSVWQFRVNKVRQPAAGDPALGRGGGGFCAPPEAYPQQQNHSKVRH